MAYIEVTNNYGWEIDVRVTDLSWDYSYSGRLATFSISGISTNYVTQIEAETYNSPKVTISGLEPGVTYTIKCTISGIVGSSDVKLSSISVTTKPGLIYAFYKQGNLSPLWTHSHYLEESDLDFLSSYELKKVLAVSSDYFRLGAKITDGDGVYISYAPYNLSDHLNYGETYIIGCSVYYNGLYYDFPTIEVCEHLLPEIISVSRQEENPWIADVELICYEEYPLEHEYCIVSGYEDGGIWYWNNYEPLTYLQGAVRLSIPLYHIGENKIWLAYYYNNSDSFGVSEYDVHYIDPIPLSFSISNKYADLTGYLDFEIGQFFNMRNGYDEYLYRNSLSIYAGFEGYYEPYSISSDGYCICKYENNEQSGVSGVARVEIWDNGVKTHVYEKNIYYPPKATITLTASRDETNPQNIYASVWVDNAYSDISKIQILNSDQTVLGTYSNPTSYPIDFTFYNMGTEKRKIYARIYRDDEYRTSGDVYLEAFIPLITPWTWDDSNGDASQAETINAYNAIDLKLNTAEFSYLVWNDLVEKVREAYRLKNGGENTVYEQYLNAALISSADTLYEKKLLATKFNNVRAVIGGVLSTFNANDNSVYDHYSDIGDWDMQPGEKVLGSYIKALAAKLNEGIGDLL